MGLQGEVKTIFSHLGRSPIEAETYLAILTLGFGTASEIAKKVGEGRTKVYFHIKKLVAEGILHETRRGQRQIFVPLPPSELAATVSKWAMDLRGLVPELEAAQKGAVETPRIEVTESKAGHERIYEELASLPVGSSFRVLQGKESLEQELTALSDETLGRFFSALIKRNIITKGLFTNTCLDVPKSILSAKSYEGMQRRPSNLAVLPEEVLRVEQLMFIYANKVAFLFPEMGLVMTITHQGISDILAATFDALHGFGEKVAPTW